MPLEQGSSKAAISKNIKTEIASGRPRSQAVAIAMNIARKNGGKIPMKKKSGKVSMKK
jgi:hypothetical protein